MTPDEDDDSLSIEDRAERLRERGERGRDTFGVVKGLSGSPALSARPEIAVRNLNTDSSRPEVAVRNVDTDPSRMQLLSSEKAHGLDVISGPADSESDQSRSDGADTKAANEGPEYGPVDFPPPTPADVAPPPEGLPEQDFAPYSPTKPPAQPAPDPSRDFARQLAGSVVGKRYTPSAAVSDAAIAKAQGADRSRREHDNFTAALSAALLRRPYAAPSGEDTAPDLLQQRAREESDFEKGKQQDLSAAALMARALKGEKPTATPGALSEYQKYEMDRNARLDAEKKTGAEKKAADAASQLERDRATLQKDFPEYDLSQADEKTIEKLLSLRHAKATESVASSNLAIARAQEGRKKGEYDALKEDIPFAGGKLKYTGTGTPRPDDVEKAQNTASLYGAALAGMDDLGVAMADFAKHPGAATRDAVVSKTQAVAGHLNTALGQGAMSVDERAQMSRALGVDLLTPGGIQAFVDKLTGKDAQAAADITRRLRSVRESTHAAAIGKLAPYHFAPEGGAATAAPTPPPEVEPTPEGLPDTARKLKDGNWYVPTNDGWVRWRHGK